jgi:proton glutamate symport protein
MSHKGGILATLIRRLKTMTLSTQILVAMFIGIFFGYFWPTQGVALKPIGDMFIRGIKMIVVPLIFSCLVYGVAGTGDFKKLGRLGLRTLVWFEVATTGALLIGMGFVNIFQPGKGLNLVASGADAAVVSAAAQRSINWVQFFMNMIPTNIVDAMARQDMLQIVVFSTIFGMATAAMAKEGEQVAKLAENIAKIMFKFVAYIMKLAPIGIGAMMAYTVGRYGLKTLIPLLKLILTVYASLAFFVFTVLWAALAYFKISFWQVLKKIKEPFLIGFTTTTGEVAIPIAIKRLEEFGVPKYISSLVIPIGYTLNMDGSTLYISGAVIFISQVYGIHLSFAQQLSMILVLMLATKGIAAVPSGALVVIAGALATVGLPAEGLALIIGIDRVLDMARSGCNMLGNCVASVLVAKWENVLGTNDAAVKAAEAR